MCALDREAGRLSRLLRQRVSRAAELANTVLSRVDVVGVASHLDELQRAGDIAIRLSPSSQSSFRMISEWSVQGEQSSIFQLLWVKQTNILKC